MDLHVEVPAVSFESLSDERRGERSVTVRERVVAARSRQQTRFADSPGVYANAQMDVGLIRRHARPSRAVARLLQHAVDRTGLSARAYHRVLKVARTIADLTGAADITEQHALEALQYRVMDRRGR